MKKALRITATLLGLSPALAEWYVDVDAPNCEASTGSASAPFCNITDAVNAASGGDTIHIAPGTYVENLLLDKDLTLIGTGGELVTTVDGAQSGSVVTVGSGATTSLTGLTLTNGRALRGGGIFSSNGALTLTSSTVSGNTASGPAAWAAGGGLYVRLGSVDLTDSNVTGNTATGSVGAVGGGVWTYFAAVTLTSSTVSDNTATRSGYDYSYGGGIYADGGTVSLTGSTVSGNDTGRAGGGIFIDSFATVTLTSTTVTGNTALDAYVGGEGGGVFNSSGTVALEDSTVSGNAAYWSGGGISCDPRGIVNDGAFVFNSVILTNTTVSGNSADLGGGIYNYQGRVVLDRSEVSSNTARFGGGVENLNASLLVRSSKVSGNQASRAGGGIGNAHGTLVLRNSTVTGNASFGAGGVGLSGGGGIHSYTYVYPGYLMTGEVELTNCTVAMNTNTDPSASGGIESPSTPARLTNCVVWGNENGQVSAGATVGRSLVQGGWTGAGAHNLDADPLFVDPASGLFQLSAGSPAIDAGRNGALSGIETDLDGNPRFVDDPATPDTGVSWRAAHVPSGTRGFGPIIDLGAYEFQAGGGAWRRNGPRPRHSP